MPATSPKPVEIKAFRRKRAGLRLADAKDRAAQSPVLQQQALLQVEFKTEEAKWSPRRTAAFVGLTCGGFWLSVLIAALNIGR